MEKSRKVRASSSLNLWKQVAIGSFFLLASLIFSLFFIVEAAISPSQSGKQQAVEIARKHVELKGETEVSLYNGKEAYYSVRGTNAQGREVVVFVPQTSSDIFVYELNDGKTEAEARVSAQAAGAHSIDKVTLGYAENQPIWEVKSGTVYYLISFETGELVKKEGI